jgi:hypothetical protein
MAADDARGVQLELGHLEAFSFFQLLSFLCCESRHAKHFQNSRLFSTEGLVFRRSSSHYVLLILTAAHAQWSRSSFAVLASFWHHFGIILASF